MTFMTDARALEHPATADIRLEVVLHALSDPMRLIVVRTLATAPDEVACSDVPLPVSKSTTTHHFRVLREAGVINQIYRGTSKMNALRRDDLDALFPGLLDRVLAAADGQAARLDDTPGMSPLNGLSRQ
jgi:DNA-binding transcriptional ArsR family regulator